MKIETLLLIGAVLYLWSKRNPSAPNVPGSTFIQPIGVTCLDSSGMAYTIPTGPCPPGMTLPPPGIQVGNIITNPGMIDSGGGTITPQFPNAQYY